MSDFDLFSAPQNKAVREDEQGSNVPEYSVSEISQTLKRTVEDNFSHIRIRGEISRVTVAKSGHLYTSLKDENAVLDAICWRGTLSKLSIKPEEGMEVVATGRLTTYPGRSNYQMIIEDMQLAGQGALLKLLEDRRKKLLAEGLFDQARKKEIPFLPKIIGVVTSPTGAVIRDILHRIEDRFPTRVLLIPTMVQGQGSEVKIAHAIAQFNKLKGELRPDVLIVARGGGSLEDLMPFNEEIVVRAVASSDIPVISAVGHETDTTLIDYAADLRAPTPTGAAEKAVPVRLELQQYINEASMRLSRVILSNINNKLERTTSLASRLPKPERLLEIKTQKFDYAVERLSNVMSTNLERRSNKVNELGSRLIHPKALVNFETQKLNTLNERLASLPPRLFEKNETKLNNLSNMLETLSFKSVLKRGYAVLRDQDDKIISNKAAMPDEFIVEMVDGKQKVKKS